MVGYAWRSPGEGARSGEGSVRRTLELLDDDKIALIARIHAILEKLPVTDTAQVLALSEALARRDADASYELALEWSSDGFRLGSMTRPVSACAVLHP